MYKLNLIRNREISDFGQNMTSLAFKSDPINVFSRLCSFNSVPANWVHHKDLFIEMEEWTESECC